jgi:hypothetical protein
MRTVALCLFLAALARPAAAETWTSYPKAEYEHYGFVTDTADATAILLNPAGLAGGPGSNLYFDLSGDHNELTEYVAALQGKAFGFAYRHRDLHGPGVVPNPGNEPQPGEGNLDAYTAAGGYGRGSFKFGASAAWTNTDLPGKDAFSWNAGLLMRVGSMFTLGGTVINIQHPRFLDGNLKPRYTYGITASPLFGLLTLSVQGSHEDGNSDIIDMTYGAKVHLKSGLSLAATVEDAPGDPPTLGASATYFFGRGAVSGRARTTDGTDGFRGQLAFQTFDQFWQSGGGLQ